MCIIVKVVEVVFGDCRACIVYLASELCVIDLPVHAQS